MTPMADTGAGERPLTIDDLTAVLAGGCKPKDQWRIGAEHEKLGFVKADLRRPSYDEPSGIRAMLTGLQRFGWTPVEEGGHLIALERGGASVSLEPGGQFELSGAPLEDMHQICDETGRHLMEVKMVADEIGLGFLGLGFDPLWARADIPIMPMGRTINMATRDRMIMIMVMIMAEYSVSAPS